MTTIDTTLGMKNPARKSARTSERQANQEREPEREGGRERNRAEDEHEGVAQRIPEQRLVECLGVVGQPDPRRSSRIQRRPIQEREQDRERERQQAEHQEDGEERGKEGERAPRPQGWLPSASNASRPALASCTAAAGVFFP